MFSVSDRLWRVVSPSLQSAARRFETAAGRFRLAVTSGFILAAVGVLIVGVGLKVGRADLIWGGMHFGSGSSAPSPQYVASRQPVRSHARVRVARHDGKAIEGGGFQSGRSMCVRLCDGFAFPVGDYHGGGDRVAHEATCAKECPGAATALYVLPQGSDTIADAREVDSGRPYSKLPDAFHYTTYLEEACSCHPPSGSRIASLLRDFTLRRGDAVMTRQGLRVFHGGAYPFKRRDFVALSRSRDIRRADRANLRAIERASLVQPTTVAEAPPQTRVSRKEDRTGALQHQARN